MSSNKIGFLTALMLYTPIVIAFMMSDFNLIGNMGEDKSFSIRLENIGNSSKKDSAKKDAKKHIQKQRIKVDSTHLAESAKDSMQKDSTQITESSTDSSLESSAKNNADSTQNSQNAESSHATSILQNSTGKSDLYLNEVMRIINSLHTKERITNLYGVVSVSFSINLNGEVENLIITKSSKNARLDSVALRMIRRAIFPRPPKVYHIKTSLVYKKG